MIMQQRPIPAVVSKLVRATKRYMGAPIGDIKYISVPSYTSIFNSKNGTFARCGDTVDENPSLCPLGPEVMYIELSTVCHQGCPWCYKSNRAIGTNMSLEMFTSIVSKLPRSVMQIAFGIGDMNANLDLIPILNECRKRGYVPNITINGIGLTESMAEQLASVCGAIAISRYTPPDRCYDAVAMLGTYVGTHGYTLSQIGVYQLLCMETVDQCFDTIRSFTTDSRLKNAFSLMFLTLKPKGSRNMYHRITDPTILRSIMDAARAANVMFGFDCCSAASINDVSTIRDLPIEPCEASLFSLYCNVKGMISPCSFLEGEHGFPSLSLADASDFLTDIWFHDDMRSFRQRLLSGSRRCPRWVLQ